MHWTRRLRPRHLQLLIKLAETGSLSDTARQAHSTQPGLSKWLKELEEDAGAPLFVRHARGLQPTPQGELLISHARRILSEMERAQGNLDAMREGTSSTVIIGVSPAAAPCLVPDAIGYFLQRQPHARVSLHEGTMNDLLERLEQGGLDVVVGRVDNYRPRRHLNSEMLFHEPLRIVARPHHPLLSDPAPDWNSLHDYDWLLWPEETPIRNRLDQALTNAGQKPLPCRVESTSLMANLWLLQSSNMLAVASARVAEHFTRRGLMQVVPFDLDADGAIGMCWRDEPHPQTALTDMLETLRQASRHPFPSAAGPSAVQGL